MHGKPNAPQPVADLIRWITGASPAATRRRFLRQHPARKHNLFDLRPGSRPWLHGIQPMANGKAALWTVPTVRPGDRVRTSDGLYGVTEARELTETAMHGMVIAALLPLDDVKEELWVS
jgi:hypothetical protein